MQIAVISLLFLATAPIHLLPAILAVFLRCPGAAWVVIANLAIWLGFPLLMGSGMPLLLDLALTLVLWLCLLRVVLVKTSAGPRDGPATGVARVPNP